MWRLDRVLSFDEVVDGLLKKPLPHASRYLAMFSSPYGGIVRDPALMMVPVDDHMVHRGDGIFEAVRCVGGRIYLLDPHLDRLERSARAAELDLPVPRSEMVETIKATVRAGRAGDCMVRLFVSRGPGGFTTNPYECTGPQLYIVVTSFDPPPPEKYAKGVTLEASAVPMKAGFFAAVKSCNYLPNVLMKKEAVDRGVDYTVSVDARGLLGEGSTENVGIVTREGELLAPRFERVLRGTTLVRVMELAKALVERGKLRKVGEGDVSADDILEAREMIVVGTTIGVLPAVSYQGKPVGTGRPGPLAAALKDLLDGDMTSGAGVLTPVWD